jgi:hypothetical protein
LLYSLAAAAELGDAASLYADLIGAWEVDVIDYDADGARRTSRGEWHFGWALEGRAVQDVFVVPARALRNGPNLPRRGNRYGTTLRFFDPEKKTWRAIWINPVTGAVNSLVACREGAAIVQAGVNDEGQPIRWSFVEISRDRFHWIGSVSKDGGATWQTQAEFLARRVSFDPLR